MAINFSVSYTFSPSTTISSSQVNTNFSDEASVWQGLEAETKTLAKLKVDIDPTLALEVATKQYVDHYSTWRRPVLVYSSVTTVTVESGLDGTSGDIPMLFPDGSMRTETSTTRTNMVITQNAVLTTSGGQGGLRTSLSEATNTWYAIYAVKCTDDTTKWMSVGDTVLPIRANYATLNSNFGTNGWVYLGLVRNGDNSAATGDLLSWTMVGNKTCFWNQATGNSLTSTGLRLATTAGATSVTYTYAAGTGTTSIPNNVLMVDFIGIASGGSGTTQFANSANAYQIGAVIGTGRAAMKFSNSDAASGLQVTNSSSVAMDIFLAGFTDGVLGVGSNPIL